MEIIIIINNENLRHLLKCDAAGWGNLGDSMVLKFDKLFVTEFLSLKFVNENFQILKSDYDELTTF